MEWADDGARCLGGKPRAGEKGPGWEEGQGRPVWAPGEEGRQFPLDLPMVRMGRAGGTAPPAAGKQDKNNNGECQGSCETPEMPRGTLV